MHPLEKGLLQLTLHGHIPADVHCDGSTHHPIQYILRGDPAEALQQAMEALVACLPSGHLSHEIPRSATQLLRALHEPGAFPYLQTFLLTEDHATEETWLLFTVAVAALLLFVQENITGPFTGLSSSLSPPSSLEFDCDGGDDVRRFLAIEWGEELISQKIPLLQCLALAQKILLMPLRSSTSSACYPLRFIEKGIKRSPESKNEAAKGGLEEASGVEVFLDPLPWLMHPTTTTEYSTGRSSSHDDDPHDMASSSHFQATRTWAWWALRAVVLQQRCLAGPSGGLKSLLSALTSFVEYSLGMLNPPSEQQQHCDDERMTYGSEVEDLLQEIRPFFLLEQTLCEAMYGDHRKAAMCVQKACACAGFSAVLTGALGVRTVHQVDARAQLVLSVSRQNGTSYPSRKSLETLIESDVLDSAFSTSEHRRRGIQQEDRGDVLKHPKIIGEELKDEKHQIESDTSTHLTALEQALVLGLAVCLKKEKAADALRPWEIAAYSDLILRQKKSLFLLRAVAELQASRCERDRPRTRDRALLRLEAIVSGLSTPVNAAQGQDEDEDDGKRKAVIPVQSRLACAWSVWMPLKASLEKEHAEALIAAGLIGEALHIFERLELWEGLILCYRLLGKKAAAEHILRERLREDPQDPQLWCVLGDLTEEDTHYEHAWNVSHQKYARAARSLARGALQRQDYQCAADFFRRALALSPLGGPSGGTWFQYGYCALKIGNEEAALEAFSRCALMDPDNGEAWNNMAVVHMKKEHWPEAYSALTEAVKHKRESWQTWDNYGRVAAMTGQWQAAARALSECVTLTEGRRVDLEILEKVFIENQEEICRDAESALSKLLGRLMKQIASFQRMGDGSAESRFWGVYAQYLTCLAEGAQQQQQQQQHRDMAVECLVKRVRILQGRDWLDSRERYEEYCMASLDLCQAYLVGGKPRDLAAARMHLRNLVKQAEKKYEDEEDAVVEQARALLARVSEGRGED